MKRIVCGLCLALRLAAVLALAAALPVHGSICVQDTDFLQRVRGVVLTTDSGSVDLLPGAVVTLRRGDFEAFRVTDSHGYFSFPPLRPGDYELEAVLDGWQRAFAQLRVRNGASTRQVLVIDMTFLLEGCSFVRTTPWRDAQKLQLEALE